MWQDVMKQIDEDYNLGAEFNETLLEIRLPNKSSIRLLGIDSNPKQMRKLLGGKYKLVVIDEVAFFESDVNELIQKVILPALADHSGECWLISTSSDLTQGLFYDITSGPEGMCMGWSVHKWSWRQNPHTCKAVQSLVDELIAANPLIVNTAHFQQHYENRWTIDDDQLVYKFDASRNVVNITPKLTHFMMGVDLGYNDATAFVIGGWSSIDKRLYILYSEKESGLDFTQVAQKIRLLEHRYTTSWIVIDGANKQGVQEMMNRHDLNLKSADKANKWDYIRLMNADLITRNVLIVRDTNQDLIIDYQKLIKDPNSKKPAEHPKCENHLNDAALYLWRECTNWLSRPIEVRPKLTYEERCILEERQMEDFAYENIREKRKDEDFWQVPDDYMKL